MATGSPAGKGDGDDFTWGDEAVVKPEAPQEYRPGSHCAVVGFTRIDGSDLARRYAQPIGTVMCIVEYLDGSSAEVPEFWLRRDVSDQSE